MRGAGVRGPQRRLGRGFGRALCLHRELRRSFEIEEGRAREKGAREAGRDGPDRKTRGWKGFADAATNDLGAHARD